MGWSNFVLSLYLISLCLFSNPTSAQLRKNYYANICPNVESIVKNAVTSKFKQTFVTVPATIRLFFHDCFVQVKKNSFLEYSISFRQTHFSNLHEIQQCLMGIKLNLKLFIKNKMNRVVMLLL